MNEGQQQYIFAATSMLYFFSCLQAEKKTPKNITQLNYVHVKKFIEKKIEKIIRKHHLPGFTIALIDDQKIVYQQASGLANIDKRIPVTNDTYFKIWSIAKVFTAIEIFREIEEGLIDIDKEITNYLPDIQIKSREVNGRPIVPISDRYVVICSGAFEGETIEYSKETGYFIHQNTVFIPNDHE